jgi:hypothetical protein
MKEHPLTGAITKIRRADAHIETLYLKIRDYIQSHPHVIFSKRDPDTGHGKFVIKITHEPPPDLPAIVGDILHNLRSALDYIAAEALKQNGSETTRWTQFPICRTYDDFYNESFGHGRLLGIASKPFTRIMSCQPYQFGPDKIDIHPLWLLRNLSNFDKHHALTLSAISFKAHWRYLSRDGRVLRQDILERRMYDGETIGSMPSQFIDEHAKIEANITTEVSFRNSLVADREVVATLHVMREFFDTLVMPLIAPCFPPLPEELALRPNKLYEWVNLTPPNVPPLP